MAETYPNSGILSRNKRKEQDKHPDHTGSATIDGKDYWVNAWVKDGKDGKFFSLSFKLKEGRQDSRPAPSGRRTPDLDDDIPF